MKKVTEEYFEELIDTIFQEKEELEMNISTSLPFDEKEETEIVITSCEGMENDEGVECYTKYKTEKFGIEVFMYHIKNRNISELSEKFIEEIKNSSSEINVNKWFG